jgi:hypothetical protein
MNKIFQAKHWQIFVTGMGFSFLQGMVSGVNLWLDSLLHTIYLVLYLGWLLFLGSRLRKISPSPQLNYHVFLFVGCTLLAFIITFRFLALYQPDVLKMFENTPVLLSGMAYLLISLIVLTSFVGKNLKAIEEGNDIDINDYVGDVVGLIFWPIGIWTFQPRINRLMQGTASADTRVSGNTLRKVGAMKISTINRLIGYGILVFSIGFFLGVHWIKYLQLLMPLGSLMTFLGVIYFFKETNLEDQFKKHPREDMLTYFWNVIVLKLWTSIFVLWMITMDLTLITNGLL